MRMLIHVPQRFLPKLKFFFTLLDFNVQYRIVASDDL